jgi:NADP-dependent 3-hydroxy acid dehydrogenase YdfG/acyl carrier protein
MQLFDDGALHPLPYRAFAAEHAEEAFRYMQQARQIGKILISYPNGVPAPRSTGRLALQLDPRAAYLVAGGTSGLGFATAQWLAARGARQLVLVSRRGALADGLEPALLELNEQGVDVTIESCDITDAADVDALIARIARRGAPLKGVIHSAMVIDDGLVANLTDARFAQVLAPKVAGAWNLHRATSNAKLDFFVVYSSATTFLGNPGQASYVAANAFLESLVTLRRQCALPATFMAWGPLADVGFLARNDDTLEALQARIGASPITSDDAMTALERALVDDVAGEAVFRLDWNAISRVMPTAHAPRYSELPKQAGHDPRNASTSQLRGQIAELPPAASVRLVEETLQAQMARILHLPAEKIDVNCSVLELGLDSLMGMELGMAIEECFEVKLSVMTLAQGATVHSLAEKIVQAIIGDEPDGNAHADAQQQMAALAMRHAVDLATHPIDTSAAKPLVVAEYDVGR